MKNLNRLTLTAVVVLAVLVLAGQAVFAQTCDSTGVKAGGRKGFVDANNDGINDNAADHDSDGIPNGKDPDFVRAGSGKGHGFVDVDGDGINDLAQDFDGDGIPNGKDADYVKPKDGTGRKMMNGSRSGGFASGRQGFKSGGGTGSATCTGSATGPKNAGGRRGGR